MNKFFPLPILAALLGAFLALAHFTSVYAQQHDSPASARKLEADAPMSLTLSAYATEYFYFSLPNTGKVIPTITLSDSAQIHIQLHDSREASLKYAISSSHVITFQDTLSGGERYFLKLSSASSQDKKLKITLRYAEKATAKPKISTNSKPKKSAKVGNSSKIKSSKTSNAATNSKSRTSAKTKSSNTSSATANSKSRTSAKTKSSNTSGATANSKSKENANPIKSADIEKSGGTETSTPKPVATVPTTTTPKKSTDSHTMNPNSKSNFSLSTHFLRTKAGTSLALAEALNLSKESSSLSYRCIFSDRISIQNGILYSKTPGIAVIEITGKNFKSSCTICIK